MFKISVLTVGDEICIGQVVNTNAAWIATECTQLGCRVAAHSIIGDEKQEITEELKRLLGFSDFVIITGGLGPTHDDVTKDALCEFFDDTLVLHEPTLHFLTNLLLRRGLALSERNKTQAFLPSKCRVITNFRGTAPGMMFERDGKTIISLPGVPAEMQGIMTEFVLPYIAELSRGKECVSYRTLLTTGITEANLADLIGEPAEFLESGTLAFLPSYQGARLRIGVRGTSAEEIDAKIARIEEVIRNRAGKFIFGTDDDSLVSVAARLLVERGETIAVAESCTGGLLGAALTDIAGSSSYFQGGVITYSNNSKESELGVNRETLVKFGAVSGETVEEMAIAVCLKFKAVYGIAISGTAGPGGGSADKPVGTVWIALASSGDVISRKFIFGSDRRINRERTVGAALAMLMEKLRGK
ncbi:competence/damage-inducible protein A [Ignavibacteria bacterium]|nr:competence/damage-inducible protein A [Bacteroidota bacterium]MCZ2133049.1 competence/damage-inducible protein A [Bacteroidota bacterium]